MLLIHETDRQSAKSILKSGRLYARNVDRCDYHVNSGPFFHVEGEPVQEIATNPNAHQARLIFKARLPEQRLSRCEVTHAIANGESRNFHSRVVIELNPFSGAVMQARIIPNALELGGFEGVPKWRWRRFIGRSIDVLRVGG